MGECKERALSVSSTLSARSADDSSSYDPYNKNPIDLTHQTDSLEQGVSLSSTSSALGKLTYPDTVNAKNRNVGFVPLKPVDDVKESVPAGDLLQFRQAISSRIAQLKDLERSQAEDSNGLQRDICTQALFSMLTNNVHLESSDRQSGQVIVSSFKLLLSFMTYIRRRSFKALFHCKTSSASNKGFEWKSSFQNC